MANVSCAQRLVCRHYSVFKEKAHQALVLSCIPLYKARELCSLWQGTSETIPFPSALYGGHLMNHGQCLLNACSEAIPSYENYM